MIESSRTTLRLAALAAVMLTAATDLSAQQALGLDEIIVSGTATETRRRALGATVSTVDVDDLGQDVAFTSVQDVLSGRVPGLRYTRVSGDVGTGSPLTLRGVGSFDLARNQPLVYLDGIRLYTDANAGPAVGSGPSVNLLDDLDTEDIDRIEILKGPAAASLYGTEASAGVIHILTKRGREGSPEVNVSVRRGINYVSDPAGRLGTQWTCPTDPAPGPTDCQAEWELSSYNMYEEATRYISQGYFDWPTENLFQNGGVESYALSVRGGTPSVRYFLSAHYDDEEGVVWYNSDERFSLRGTADVTLGEMFSLAASTTLVDGHTRFMAPVVGDGGVWQDLAWSNGFYLDRVNAFSSPESNPRLGGFQEHLPADVAEVEATREYTRFVGSARLRFVSPDFRIGLLSGRITARAVVGIDKGWDTNRNLFPLEDGIVPTHLQFFVSTWDPVYIPETVEGQMAYARPITTSVSIDHSVTASLRSTGGWRFDTSIGAQYHSDERDVFANSGRGFASTLSTTINQIAQSRITTTYEAIENRSLGFYVQEDVSWRNRVFLTGALRLDDSSTFGVDTPVQTYARLSGAWVVSDESFWDFDSVDALRLRGAWGQAGRRPTPLANQPLFEEGPGPDGKRVIQPSLAGNGSIGPEVSSELELGFDVALFDERLGATLSRYWRWDEGLLLPVPNPLSSGFPGTVERNVGAINNWGWEAVLRGRLYEGPALSVELGVAIDHTNNEIEELGGFDATHDVAMGYPYPSTSTDIYVISATFDPAGDQTNAFGRAMSAMCDSGTRPVEDDQYGYHSGGTPVPCGTVPDRSIVIGPAFATYAVSVAPRIGLLNNRLQIYAMAEGQYGRWGQANDTEWGHISNNSRVSRLDNDPAWAYGDRVGDDTKRRIYDADFWKLREVGVRYTLRTSWAAWIGAQQASVSVSARNVWTIWRAQSQIYGRPVTDPEFGTPSLDGGGNYWEAPPISSLSMTLRATF